MLRAQKGVHSPLVLSGAGMCICWLTQGIPSVAKAVFEAGVLEVVMAQLSEFTAMQRIDKHNYLATALMTRMKDCAETAQNAGVDIVRPMLECGYIDMLVGNMQAYTQMADSPNDTSVVAIWYGIFYFLSAIDLRDTTAEPIKDKLRAEPAAMRFALDHDQYCFGSFKMQTSTHGTMVAANVFGRDEDGGFSFAQREIDSVIYTCGEILQMKEGWGGTWSLGSNVGQSIVSLAVSDHNKAMLLQNDGFIPLILDGLLLDPEHPRKDTNGDIKAVIQKDFGECIQQISLFPAGREALKTAGIVEILDELVDKAWSEGAKDCARGALMQLTDRHVEVHVDPDALWIMMSCECRPNLARMRLATGDTASAVVVADEWSSQDIVKRIVTELQHRKYLVWFDRASLLLHATLALLPESFCSHTSLGRSMQLSG
eukprot:COSAG06_NODE_1387_length_9616_cov_4.512136_2_plen_428_part_00